MKALHITVTSAGHADGDLARFEVGGQDLGEGWTKRGINVAVIDDQGRLQVGQRFDTYKHVEASQELTAFLGEQAAGTLLAIAVKDEASRNLDAGAKAALAALGSKAIE
ncbi:MAG: hypothetical protein KC431_23920, partial [Myxococcales bacterium]|nr:hypothetical protein [Myxococcales bacterium]